MLDRSAEDDYTLKADEWVDIAPGVPVAGRQPKGRTKRTRQQRRSATTRRRLIEAARQVFAERGLDMARIDEITERADLGKGTFYYHFGSKEKIVGEVIQEVIEELVAVIERRCRGIADLRELLSTLIGAHIEFFCNRWEDFVLYFQGRTDLTLENSYAGIETPFFKYLERVEDLLASVIKGRLPGPVLRRIACAVTGFVSGYYAFAAIASGDEDIDAPFRALRGAMAASLARFIQEASSAQGSGVTRGSEDGR